MTPNNPDDVTLRLTHFGLKARRADRRVRKLKYARRRSH